MSELLHKLGVDWKLLMAQGLNFLALLAILRFTVYKPVLRLLDARRGKIEKGLRDAASAATHLAEVEVIGKGKMAEAERSAVAVLAEAERGAKERETIIMDAARKKETEMLRVAGEVAKRKEAEAMDEVLGAAVGLVRRAVGKVAEKSPDLVDESLVREAVRSLTELPK
jgi:F-type H+-transporting ATPase subunit b